MINLSAGKSKTHYGAYNEINFPIKNAEIDKIFSLPSREVLYKNIDSLNLLSANFTAHCFNLLGSDWFDMNSGVCQGFLGYKYSPANKTTDINEFIKTSLKPENAKFSKKAAELIDADYKRINWQLDFRSGYEWNAAATSSEIIYGNVPGADIKIPWELGRMQHLNILALHFALSGDEKSVHEFENQILDFTAANPTNTGTQWMTAMDVSLRAVQWICSYNLLQSAEAKFRDSFSELFMVSLINHGRFIFDNLEWAGGLRANHYLSNIAGLIILSAALPVSDETASWFNFACNELAYEAENQFLEDGGNFEASSAYHCLSAAFVIIPLLIVLKISPNKTASLLKGNKSRLFEFHSGRINISNRVKNRLIKIIEFSAALFSNDSSVPQIGDNDSGSFILPDFEYYLNANPRIGIETAAVLNCIHEGIAASNDIANSFIYNSFNNTMCELLGNNIDKSLLSKSNNSFNDFGIHFIADKNFRISVITGSNGQYGKGGHAHNDKLSVTIDFKGSPLIVDPGTFNYTASAEIRNRYRSTAMHNTLSLNGLEQNGWFLDDKDDLFWMQKDRTKCKVVEINKSSLTVKHYAFKVPYQRKIYLKENLIGAEEYCNTDGKKEIPFHLHPNVKVLTAEKEKIKLSIDSSLLCIVAQNAEFRTEDYFYSPGYGIRQEAKKLILITNQRRFSWILELIKP